MEVVLQSAGKLRYDKRLLPFRLLRSMYGACLDRLALQLRGVFLELLRVVCLMGAELACVACSTFGSDVELLCDRPGAAHRRSLRSSHQLLTASNIFFRRRDLRNLNDHFGRCPLFWRTTS